LKLVLPLRERAGALRRAVADCKSLGPPQKREEERE
jgi:hypothetical protein